MVLVHFVIIILFLLVVMVCLVLKRKNKKRIKGLIDEISKKNKDSINSQKEISNLKFELGEKILKILEHKENIELVHKNLSDSIIYATRIQNAMLQTNNVLEGAGFEYFVLFRPKDNVSGDFYFVERIDKSIYIAVADCTGHGVPGALMSMMGIAYMKEIIAKKNLTSANSILNSLREKVIKTLNSKDDYSLQNIVNGSITDSTKKHLVYDGMDMSLCIINIKTLEMQYSGANNPIYLVRDKNNPINIITEHFESEKSVLCEMAYDKMPIGLYKKHSDFNNHTLDLKSGDQIYLFTDGYADQFGGPRRLKYMYKRFKKLLLKNSVEKIEKQKELLETEIDKWMTYGKSHNKFEQTDDMCILGIKIP